MNRLLKSAIALGAVLTSSVVGMAPHAAQAQHQNAAAVSRDSVEHPIPLVPIKIDGVKHEAKSIKKFDGQALFSVVDKNAQQEGVMYVFTSEAKFKQYMNAHHPASVAKAAKVIASPLRHDLIDDIHSYFYVDIKYNSRKTQVAAGNSVSDLSNVSQGCTFCGSFNDAISSVRATPNGNGTYLYSDRNYGGSILYIAASIDAPDLRAYSYNDRASSIFVAGS